MANELPTTGSTHSPQRELIDELIWSNLSAFWTQGYDPSDLDALSGLYEAMFQVLDAEYVRLFEINASKSLDACPVYSQRRWARLDLNRYNELKAFLQFLRSGLTGVSGEAPENTAQLDCDNIPTRHAKHWHICFPYIIPVSGSNVLELSFPIGTTSLVQIYSSGVRLMPKLNETSTGWDFELLPDGKTLRFRAVQPNQKLECVVAFDFGGEAFTGFRPIVYQVDTFLGPNVVKVPENLSTGLPVHVLVVRNPPDEGAGGLLSTNTLDFNTNRIFLRYTGDANAGGVQHGSLGKIVLPTNFSLSPGDVVFVFALEPGSFDTVHSHKRSSALLTSADLESGGVITSFTPDASIPIGLFDSVDFFGQILQIFVGGLLLDHSDYRYEQGSNTFFFRNPFSIASGETLKVDVLFTEEARANIEELAVFHIHQQCFKGFIETAKEFATFDDEDLSPLPELDDEDVTANATFDDFISISEIFLVDVDIDPETIEVYIAGELFRVDVDYTVFTEGRRTRIVFSGAIDGKNVLVTFRRESLIFVFGLDDITPGTTVYGIDVTTLRNLLGDLQNLVDTFQSVFGKKIANLAALLEAAFIAAGGGNPLLALFFDEFYEYDGIDLNAAEQFLSALSARNLESVNTELISIPFMVDHVFNPTIRIQEGVDYRTIEGNIQSSIDLLAPRGPDDANPGVWWCPILFLDERMLAKNHGAVVGDIQASSQAYKNSLMANFLLRYCGAVTENFSRSAAVMLGSPMFTQDSVVRRIFNRVIAYTVTIDGVSTTQHQVVTLPPDAKRPRVGMPVFTAQSIATPIIVDATLEAIEEWQPGVLVANYDFGAARAGDKAQMTLFDPTADPDDTGAKTVTLILDILGVKSSPILGGTKTTISFRQRPRYVARKFSRIRIFRDEGPPRAAFDGIVSAVTPVTRTVIVTESEEFQLPAGTPCDYRLNDTVVRGQPVIPSLALAYDHVSRPNWHWTYPQYQRMFWEYLLIGDTLKNIDPVSDQRFVTLEPPEYGGGFTRATVPNPFPLPARGTPAHFVEDNTGDILDFTVVGHNENTILLTPGLIFNAPETLLTGLLISAASAGTRSFTFSGTPSFARVVPGNRLQVAGSTGGLNDRQYTISGVDNNLKILSVDEAVSTDNTGVGVVSAVNNTRSRSGSITFDLASKAVTSSVDKQYFETKPEKGIAPVLLTYPQTAGSASLDVGDLVKFPPAGRVHVLLPNGGLVEFEYFGRSGTRFLNCVWVEPFSSLLAESPTPADPGVLNPLIPVASQLVLVASYAERLLNPAFVALVEKRVEKVTDKEGGEVVLAITSANADKFYDLLKNNAAVLELRSMSQPAALAAVIADVRPTGSSLEVLQQHIFVDVFNQRSRDDSEQFHPMDVTVQSPLVTTGTGSKVAASNVLTGVGTTFTTELLVGMDILLDGEIRTVLAIVDDVTATMDLSWDTTGAGTLYLGVKNDILQVPLNQPEILLESFIVDPDGRFPYSFKWTARALEGGGSEQLVTPDQHSTRLIGVQNNGSYVVTFVLTNVLAQTKTVSLTVLVNLS